MNKYDLLDGLTPDERKHCFRQLGFDLNGANAGKNGWLNDAELPARLATAVDDPSCSINLKSGGYYHADNGFSGNLLGAVKDVRGVSDDEALSWLAETTGRDAPGEGGGTRPVMKALGEVPKIPPEAFEALPDVLTDGLSIFDDDRKRDVFVTGALGVLSGGLPNVWGRYFEGLFSPNLYTFVLAPAGSGKSALTWARKLGKASHERFKRESQTAQEAWEYEKEEYDEQKRKKSTATPEAPGPEPPDRWLFIPGDASRAAIIKMLEANSGEGIMIETEADTLSQTMERDWGGFSDVLRKAHPHEPISNLRSESGKEIEIARLSVILTGTPEQLPKLIPSVENGLWSRFCFYGYLPDDPAGWHDVRPKSYDSTPEERFEELAGRVDALRKALEGRTEKMLFSLQDEHWNALNDSCQAFKRRLYTRYGFSGIGTAHRTGLHIFRIAMTLAVWRLYEGGGKVGSAKRLEASDEDFQAALTLGMHYAGCAETLMQAVPNAGSSGGMPEREFELFGALPDTFETAVAVQRGASHDVPERTARRWLSRWTSKGLLKRVKRGTYRKV